MFSLNNESVLDLCTHNSNVAFSIGDVELSRSWNILGVAAHNDVISSVRIGLGYQIRPPADESNVFSFMDEISESMEDTAEASEEKETSPNDDIVNICEPSREFCYDQELLDFSGVLEEDLDYHHSDEFISGRLTRSRRRKFRPKLQIPKREEWYTGESIGPNDFIPQPSKVLSHKVHRFSSDRYPIPAFKNSPNGLVRRTCVSFVFDHSKYTVKEQQVGKRTHSHTLEKVRIAYQQKLAKRRMEIAEAGKRKAKKKMSSEEVEAAKRKKAKRRVREINLKWIESNRILQSPRVPLNELQRIIIERATNYYHQEVAKEKSWSTEQVEKSEFMTFLKF